MSEPDRMAQQDPARAINLPGSAWRATVAIGPDGTESLWLVSPTPDRLAGCACAACAPHEQLATKATTRTARTTRTDA